MTTTTSVVRSDFGSSPRLRAISFLRSALQRSPHSARMMRHVVCVIVVVGMSVSLMGCGSSSEQCSCSCNNGDCKSTGGCKYKPGTCTPAMTLWACSCSCDNGNCKSTGGCKYKPGTCDPAMTLWAVPEGTALVASLGGAAVVLAAILVFKSREQKQYTLLEG